MNVYYIFSFGLKGVYDMVARAASLWKNLRLPSSIANLQVMDPLAWLLSSSGFHTPVSTLRCRRRARARSPGGAPRGPAAP